LGVEPQLRLALQEIQQPVANGAAGSGYPPSLRTLVEGIPDTRPASKGQMQYFLRAVPRDPFASAQLAAEQTWRLRSYASPADKPQAGVDVYDVHSSSDAKALDGSFYAQW
jgi:general secretion pathway protein G